MNSHIWKQAADLVIEPDVNGYKYDCFEHSADLVRAGELAARAALPEIRKLLQPEPATSKILKVAAVKPATMPAD
jgi:hypothetical protein